MNSGDSSGHSCISWFIGLWVGIVVAFIALVVTLNATAKEVRSVYGWTTSESDNDLATVVFAVSGIVTWIVVALWLQSKLKGNTSSENLHTVTPPVRRQPIPRWVKAHLFQACGGQCAGCLDVFRQIGNMQIDHIIPVHLGGTNELDNLQLLCRSCNVKKGTGTMPQLIERLRQDGIRR